MKKKKTNRVRFDDSVDFFCGVRVEKEKKITTPNTVDRRYITRPAFRRVSEFYLLRLEAVSRRRRERGKKKKKWKPCERRRALLSGPTRTYRRRSAEKRIRLSSVRVNGPGPSRPPDRGERRPIKRRQFFTPPIEIFARHWIRRGGGNGFIIHKLAGPHSSLR